MLKPIPHILFATFVFATLLENIETSPDFSKQKRSNFGQREYQNRTANRNKKQVDSNESKNTTKVTHYAETVSPKSYPNFTNPNTTNSSGLNCRNSTNCTASSTNQAKGMSFSDKLAIFVFGFVFIVGVLGNSFVCYTFGYKCRKRRTVTETLILYLAIADLIASFINPLLYIYWIATGYSRWDFGVIGCKILPPIAPISTTLSACIIILICIDRYRSIVTPFKTRLSIFQVNISTVILALVSIFSYSFYSYKLVIVPGMTCLTASMADEEYTIPYVAVTLTFDVLYVAIFIPAYFSIFKHLRANDDFQSGTTLWESRRKGTKKVLRVLFTIGVIFALLVFPRDIANLAFTISWFQPPGIPRNELLVAFHNWFKLLHVSNSCVNIFIYSHMHEKFKKELKFLFKKIFRRRTSSSDDMYFTDRRTATEASELTPMRSRRSSSLLLMLSLKGRNSLKNNGKGSPVSPSPNLSVKGCLSHDNSKVLSTSLESTALRRSLAYRSALDQKTNARMKGNEAKGIKDTEETARSRGNSINFPSKMARFRQISIESTEESSVYFSDTEELIEYRSHLVNQMGKLNEKQPSDVSAKPTSANRETDNESDNLSNGKISNDIYHKLTNNEIRYQLGLEKFQKSDSVDNGRHHNLCSHEASYSHPDSTSVNNSCTPNTVYQGFSTSKVFGLNKPIRSASEEYSSHYGGDSDTKGLLDDSVPYDVTAEGVYDEADIASLLMREETEGLGSRETNL